MSRKTGRNFQEKFLFSQSYIKKTRPILYMYKKLNFDKIGSKVRTKQMLCYIRIACQCSSAFIHYLKHLGLPG